jgi:hypothetical protein
MRTCPSVEGSVPLITHQIGVDVCMSRQRTFFHKCHRCVYRGQAANWEPAEAPTAMLNIHAAEEPAGANVKAVELARPANVAAKADKASKASKPAKKAAAKTLDASA